MSETSKLEERQERGRVLRKLVARSSHVVLGNLQRDPLVLLAEAGVGRVERLLPLRYGRMLASPFAFFRGSALLQAHDLAGTPHSGIVQQICGDCHVLNFSGFATPERNLVFDLGDFDETHPGPWEWDVKRLMVSLVLCARQRGLRPGAADAIVAGAIDSYQQQMARYAGMGALALWYEKVEFDSVLAGCANPTTSQRLAEDVDKARRQGGDKLLAKLGQQVDGRWVLNEALPETFHIHGEGGLLAPDDDWMELAGWAALAEQLLGEYRPTLSLSHQQLLGYFTAQDLAFKVVGVGSVGMRCLVLLMSDVQEQGLLLQIKEAVPSVLARYVPSGRSVFQHEGRRVVAGQRVMQASSDIFLGASTDAAGRHFYVRQLRDMKISLPVETFDEAMLGRYGALCSRVLARAHARSGGFAPEISGYLGDGKSFAEALVKYANGYADQVQRDFDVFTSACHSGRLVARSDADFSAATPA